VLLLIRFSESQFPQQCCNKREPFVDESFDLINTKRSKENEARTHTAGIAIGKLKLLINIFPFKLVLFHDDDESKHLAYF
jgi:hypothetical protein